MPHDQIVHEITPSSHVVSEPGSPASADALDSCGWLALLAFLVVVVGRVQELLPVLAPLRLGLVTGGLAGLAWLAAPGSLPEKIPHEVKQVRYVLMLLGLAIVTLPIAVWPGHSFEFLTEQFSKTILLFLLVLYWCRSPENIRRVIWACCLGSIGSVLIGLLTGQAGDGRFNAGSETYDPNDLAWLLVTILPMLVYLYYTSGPAMRLLLLGMAFLGLYGIVLTQSRGGLLALLPVSVLLLGLRILPVSGKAVIVVMGLVVFGVLAGGAYHDRIETMWAPRTEYDRTLGGRTVLWETALTLLAANPWGVGIDGFVTAEGATHGGEGKWSASHNSLLQIGVDLGLAGFVVFLMLVASTVRELRLARSNAGSTEPQAGCRVHRGPPVPSGTEPDADPETGWDELGPLAATLEISLWGLIISGFFLSHAYSPLFYVVLGLSIACLRLAPRQDGSGEEGREASLRSRSEAPGPRGAEARER